MIFYVYDTATLSGLNINGCTSSDVGENYYGAIENRGTLTITNCTISGSSVLGDGPGGGAIDNYVNGNLTVVDSTFSGNSVLQSGFGGAISNTDGSKLTVINSTFFGNSAENGGAIYSDASSTLTVTNSTFYGNTAGSGPDIDGSYSGTGNIIGANAIDLSPLGNYGGPTQTMVPLPDSPAICAATTANATAAGLTGDQRGLPFDPHCQPGSIDAGAAQSNYALAFTTEPPASFAAGQAINPAPVVGLTESGAVAAVPSNTIAMTDTAGLLGGTTSASLLSGAATFRNLIASSPTSSDRLTASLALTSGVSVTAQSTAFQATTPPPDVLIDPKPGSVLTGPEATFTWTAAPGATGYSLWIGSTGVGSGNLYDSHATTVTSVMVGGLPANGETLYVRLNTIFGKTSIYSDYTYTAVTQAVLTAPAPGAVLAGPDVTFTWSAAAGATGYSLWLGSTGVGSGNLYDSHATTATSATASALPTNGETIYARLFTIFKGKSLSTDYTFKAATEAQSALVSPTPGTTLTGATVTFSWTASSGAIGYSLWLGSTGVGSGNLYDSHETTATSAMATNLPTNGETIYARLNVNFNGTVKSIDYRYTAQ